MLTSLLLSAVHFALGAEPTLASPPAGLRVGVESTISLRESQPGDILVDACAPIELVRQEGDAWVPVAAPVCPANPPALVVQGEVALPLHPPAPGTYQARVTWGSSCTLGLPFVMSACGRWGVATTPAFVVAP